MLTEKEFTTELKALILRLERGPSVAPFTHLITIGQRLAQRVVSGQGSEGIDRDAQLFLDQMAELPDELRVLI